MQNALNHKNYVQKNANQRVHDHMKREVMTCYSLFIENPFFIIILFIYNVMNLVVTSSFDYLYNMVIGI
jgi:hypothetical protein